MNDERCACGKPLHYSNPHLRTLIDSLIAQAKDEFVTIETFDGRRWRVQRHYIALHGIKADELASLGFKEITQ